MGSPARIDPEPIHIPGKLPAPVSEWRALVSRALIEALGADRESLILFASAAEGRMRASSDVNSAQAILELRGSKNHAPKQALQALEKVFGQPV